MNRQARLHVFVGSPGFEAALAVELPTLRLDGPRWPGVLTSHAADIAVAPVPLVDPTFARQQLPGARLIKADTAAGLLDGAWEALAAPIKAGPPVVALLASVPDPEPYRAIVGQARQLGDAFAQRLHALLRAPGRRVVVGSGAVAASEFAPGRDVLVVQLLLVARTSLLVSAAIPRALPQGGFDIAPWPSGNAAVPEDRAAPSRAYRKLREAFAWMGRGPGPGELCVDLGGAPGGWAWTALQAGADVVSVDRAPLAPALQGRRGLTTVQGDAFSYEPPRPVDWMLCDVICEPARTIELCARWMQRRWCRRIVATLKFKGKDGYAALAGIQGQLRRWDWPLVRTKHLFFHHNEAAIMASADTIADQQDGREQRRQREQGWA